MELKYYIQCIHTADKTMKRYVKYGEFIADLRRVFSNALKYNGAHLASDSTGITKLIYDAAEMLQERLEGLLGPFTVHLTERVERARITNAESQIRLAEQRAIIEKEEAEAKQFEQRVCTTTTTSNLLNITTTNISTTITGNTNPIIPIKYSVISIYYLY